MSNLQKDNVQNEIEKIKKEINLLQNKLKKNKRKNQNQFKNGLKHIRNILVKKDKGQIFIKPKIYIYI